MLPRTLLSTLCRRAVRSGYDPPSIALGGQAGRIAACLSASARRSTTSSKHGSASSRAASRRRDSWSTRAEGAQVEAADGTLYLDFAGGIACQNTGHGFAPVVAAIHEQVDRFLHQCFMVGTYEPYVEVCRRLAEHSPCTGESAEVDPGQLGGQAIENAVKISRAATGRSGVVVFDNGFHGRTLLTMAMTSKVRALQGRLRSLPVRDLSHRRSVSVSRYRLRRRDRARSSICSRARSRPRRSPASC